MEGCTEVVELLIDRGADLSVVDKVVADAVTTQSWRSCFVFMIARPSIGFLFCLITLHITMVITFFCIRLVARY